MQKKYIITDYGVKTDSEALQTKEIQAVIDLCRDNGGGVVVFPEGTYYVASLRMWSDMALFFKNGSKLLGSTECDDYEVYEVPAGVELRTDMQLISQYFEGKTRDEYRHAMISAYGEKNIAIIGEGNATIDGRDCFDPNGEEGLRGPHGIFFTNCENVELRGYTIQNSGSFMHQIDNCKNVHFNGVTILAGHDGIHLHHCDGMLIENCRFMTGDDCLGGINFKNLTIRNCEFNTSCQVFRLGGSHILIENCHIYGPGYYPHRMTVVKGKNDYLPRTEGRHKTSCLWQHFASMDFPSEPYHDILIRNCTADEVGRVLFYNADDPPLEAGAYLSEITFENVQFTNLNASSHPKASAEHPLTVTLRNVSGTFKDSAVCKELFDSESVNTTFTIE